MRSELFRNGIRSEIRSNPVAEALRVSRLELWLQDECDYFRASKLYLALQERDGRNGSPEGAAQQAAPPEAPEVYVEAEEVGPAQRRKGRAPSARPAASTRPPVTAGEEDPLAEVSGLLEQEIEGLLARDADLNARCAALEETTGNLRQSLGDAEARAATESSARATAEAKAAEMAELHESMQRDLSERTVAAERLQRAVAELREQLRAREQAAVVAAARVETHARELREQQTLAVALKQELGNREQQLKELGDVLTQAGMDLAAEKQGRLAAEERLRECAVARTALEQQVSCQAQELRQARAELQARQAQLQAVASRLNALRGKLHGAG